MNYDFCFAVGLFFFTTITLFFGRMFHNLLRLCLEHYLFVNKLSHICKLVTSNSHLIYLIRNSILQIFTQVTDCVNKPYETDIINALINAVKEVVNVSVVDVMYAPNNLNQQEEQCSSHNSEAKDPETDEKEQTDIPCMHYVKRSVNDSDFKTETPNDQTQKVMPIRDYLESFNTEKKSAKNNNTPENKTQ